MVGPLHLNVHNRTPP